MVEGAAVVAYKSSALLVASHNSIFVADEEGEDGEKDKRGLGTCRLKLMMMMMEVDSTNAHNLVRQHQRKTTTQTRKVMIVRQTRKKCAARHVFFKVEMTRRGLLVDLELQRFLIRERKWSRLPAPSKRFGRLLDRLEGTLGRTQKSEVSVLDFGDQR